MSCLPLSELSAFLPCSEIEGGMGSGKTIASLESSGAELVGHGVGWETCVDVEGGNGQGIEGGHVASEEDAVVVKGAALLPQTGADAMGVGESTACASNPEVIVSARDAPMPETAAEVKQYCSSPEGGTSEDTPAREFPFTSPVEGPRRARSDSKSFATLEVVP